MNVWVTRPAPGNERTEAALRAAGYRVVAAPVLEVVTVAPSPIPTLPWPDWIILVSANAARGLEAARPVIGESAPQQAPRVAAVGRSTATVWRDLGWQVDLVPAEERAEGLVAALANEDLHGRRVWIPAGDRPGSATRDLPEALARMGATAEVFRVYETRNRELEATELAALASRAPGAIVIHSPSSAEAIYSGTVPDAVATWRAAVAVAIGPVTRVRLEELGVSEIVEASEPSDGGIVTALAAMEKRP